MVEIDKLDPSAATASEMEQAIRAAEKQPDTDEQVKQVIVKVDEQSQSAAPLEKEEQPEDKYDYKQGYKDLRPLVTRLSQDLAEVKRGQVAPKKEEPVQPQYSKEQLEEYYNRDPEGYTRWVAEQVATVKTKETDEKLRTFGAVLGNYVTQNTVEKFRSRYNDFSESEPEIRKTISVLPEEVLNNPYYVETLLELGYRAVKGRKSEVDAEKARLKGQQEIINRKEAKEAAHVEGSGKSSPEQPIDMDKMTSDELFNLMKAKGAVR